jgi:hypothetical protein
MCLRRAPEKYITGAALDRAGLENTEASTSLNPVGLDKYTQFNSDYQIILSRDK